MLLLQISVFCLGLWIVLSAVASAIKTFVVPRGHSDLITASVFIILRRILQFRFRWARTFAERDRIMALYAPIGLILLLPTWLLLILLGFMGMYWAAGVISLEDEFVLSGSSLFTLGFARHETLFATILTFCEATIGLIMTALLISYLPTMYSAFSQREVAVNQLSARAGTPPSCVELILRAHRIGVLADMGDFWEEWATWFAALEESHTSLAALVFFRSPDPHHSWLTAAGTVMDAAALIASTVDIPRQPRAELAIRAGYLALRRIAHFFTIPYNPNPRFPNEPISITRAEYDAVYDQFVAKGVPVKADREQTWQDFAGWRVNYDLPLVRLCALVMAPDALWSSDRAPVFSFPSILGMAWPKR